MPGIFDSTWLYDAAMALSYAPLALYADSLRVNSALISVIGSKLAIPTPITGCVKDLSRIWSISSLEILSNYSSSSGTSVSSVRHGNAFPLMNEALLKHLAYIGRGDLNEDSRDPEPNYQKATVHITYLTPTTSTPKHSLLPIFSLSWIITGAEILALLSICIVLFFNGLVLGAIPMCCLTANKILLLILRQCTGLVFANKAALEKDKSATVAGGAALDAHIITRNWSAPDIDVIVGYSSQLHSLTNIPIRISGWKRVRYMSRLMILILIIQATTLAGLFNTKSKDVWGSIVWMGCYLIMLIPPSLMSHLSPDMLLESQPSVAKRLPPIDFRSRKAALVFIGTLPGIERRFEVGRWDYMDPFIPNNPRRNRWLAEVTNRLAGGNPGDTNVSSGSGTDISKECKDILEQVGTARDRIDYKVAMEVFKHEVGMYRVKLDA
ncbi:hypothetical protein TWF106_010932 [Orbilia oligospora]|uniref:Uncharacterized protein n=1 Tax=Orbilia oligospora TaxID=2813651 RepID=A0A7C8URT0_ORBOL|nr:hypothetical protein TWF106_010932 [Orbilia oligospora]